MGSEEDYLVKPDMCDTVYVFNRVLRALRTRKLSRIYDTDTYLPAWIYSFLHDRLKGVILYGGKSGSLISHLWLPTRVSPRKYFSPIGKCQLFSLTVCQRHSPVPTSVKRLRYRLLPPKISLDVWAKRWGIYFNVSKSKIIIFNTEKVPIPTYRLNERVPERVADSRYLGVTLQENLKFNKQNIRVKNHDN